MVAAVLARKTLCLAVQAVVVALGMAHPMAMVAQEQVVRVTRVAIRRVQTQQEVHPVAVAKAARVEVVVVATVAMSRVLVVLAQLG